ncbi:MAG: (2Fe-2S)-binding protein [Spirochaetaceae bacterium]
MDDQVCYCSNITRVEIKEAVTHGANNISEVRSYLKKNITGNCKTTHPLGICCHKDFMSVIKEFQV